METLKNKYPHRNNIIRGLQFCDAFYDYCDSVAGKTFSKELNDKSKRMEVEGITYRIINHWEKVGLLTNNRPLGKGWRKYSTLDLVWIHIIMELRRFGYPLQMIIKVKESLSKIDPSEKISNFEFYTHRAIKHKDSAYLLVFQNGKTEVVNEAQYLLTIDVFSIDNHIKICINDILQIMFPKKDFHPFSKSVELSDNENELLSMIGDITIQSINIITKDGQIERLESIELLKNDKRIIDILKENDYQDIQIIKRDGKVVNIKRTVKRKFNSNGTEPYF